MTNSRTGTDNSYQLFFSNLLRDIGVSPRANQELHDASIALPCRNHEGRSQVLMTAYTWGYNINKAKLQYGQYAFDSSHSDLSQHPPRGPRALSPPQNALLQLTASTQFGPPENAHQYYYVEHKSKFQENYTDFVSYSQISSCSHQKCCNVRKTASR